MAKSKPQKKVANNQEPIPTTTVSEPPSHVAQLFKEPIAIGLAIMVFLRPWRDGITYPSTSYFFVGFTAILCIYLAARMFIEKDSIKAITPLSLLFSFVAIAFLTGTQSVQPDVSHQGLVQYIGYIGILFLCTNGIRSRFGVGIVLGSIAFTGMLNAIYAVLHVEYTLPFIRQSIIDHPNLIRRYFNTDILSAELKNRLEMDRAFGSLLFPNALAAYMIVSIPYYFGQWWGAAKGVASSWTESKHQKSQWFSEILILLVPALTALSVAIYTFFVSTLFGTTDSTGGQIIQSKLAMTFFYILIPSVIFVGGIWAIKRNGLNSFGQLTRISVITLAAVFQLLALWMSLSRGGILGLAIGMTWTIALILLTLPTMKVRFSRVYSAIGVTLILFLLFPLTPTLSAEAPTDYGFEVPALSHDYRPQNQNLTAADINKDGVKVSLEDLADPGSLQYRITYWQVGLRMIQDNFFTGVGLNNFGTIYGKYQFLDAGDVKTAHNDFVQVFAETGIIGFLLFSSFWIYIGLAGADRILREQNRSVQFALGGMYAGVVAFLAHSFFDFNFTNPALAFMLFVVTGLFLTYGRLSDPNEPDEAESKPTLQKICLGLVIALSLYALGMSWRQIGIDYKLSAGPMYQRITYLGNDRHLNNQLEVATFLYRDLRPPEPGENLPFRLVSSIQWLIPDLEIVKSLGTVRVDVDGIPGGATRPYNDGEPITDFTYIFFGEFEKTRSIAMKKIKEQIKLFEDLDASWTDSTKTAQHLFTWNKLLLEGVRTQTEEGATAEQRAKAVQRAKAEQRPYADELLKWARALVERSPERPWNYFNLGHAMWLKGNTERTGRGQMKYYKDGLAVYKRGYELYPVNTEICKAYGEALSKMSVAFNKAGFTEEGNVYGENAKEVLERGYILSQYKYRVLGLR
jgi:hypothetical protein